MSTRPPCPETEKECVENIWEMLVDVVQRMEVIEGQVTEIHVELSKLEPLEQLRDPLASLAAHERERIADERAWARVHEQMKPFKRWALVVVAAVSGVIGTIANWQGIHRWWSGSD